MTENRLRICLIGFHVRFNKKIPILFKQYLLINEKLILFMHLYDRLKDFYISNF